MSPLFATLTVLAELQGGGANVAASYLLVIGAIVAYAAFVIVRGRRVGRQLPPDERRWM